VLELEEGMESFKGIRKTTDINRFECLFESRLNTSLGDATYQQIKKATQ
jgi:hypothetical protein